MNFKMILMMVIAPLTYAETYYRNKDVNTVGTDDKIATFLGYARKGISAIINDTELPAAPDELTKK